MSVGEAGNSRDVPFAARVHQRAYLTSIPVTDEEIERLWKKIDEPLASLDSTTVWYEVTSLRESIRRLLTEREDRHA